MPFTPSKLAARVRSITFPFDGEELHVSYRPAEINDVTLKRVRELATELQASDGDPAREQSLSLEFAGYFARILVTWDFEEDPIASAHGKGAPTPSEGVMVPITAERIVQEMARYGDFVAAHMRAVMQDYQQGNASGTASSKR